MEQIKSSNIPYVMAVITMIVVALILIGVISVARPDQDIIVLITTVFAVLAPTTLSLLTFMKAQETHLSVNSRLDEFMVNAKTASHAEGVIEGRDAANKRTDELSGKL